MLRPELVGILFSTLGNYTSTLFHPEVQKYLTKHKLLPNIIVFVAIWFGYEKEEEKRMEFTLKTFALFKIVTILPPKLFISALVFLVAVEAGIL